MNHTTDAPLEYSATPLVAGAAQSRRWIRRLQPRSVRVRLYSVFALLLFLVIGLGAFGFARLSEVNRVSEVIRNHWLRDTRILGDLSNYMSDYRTAEATQLLASTQLGFAASEKEITTLGATVARSQRAYEEIAQDPSETLLYAQFAKQWAAYQAVAAQVVALARSLAAGGASTSRAEQLTGRELEVVALLARALTNQQIAAELAISPATARTHVEHVLTKLGLHTRAQVAVWANQRHHGVRSLHLELT